jgi:RNA polymerase sigma factor (sigma-70 family)
MAKGRRLGAALRGVQTLFAAGTAGGLTDGQLLDEFRSRGVETRERAFAVLVERHGPLVLRACRSVLRDEHAAEDAFQAVFLVLARKAGSLRVRDSLAPWLHEVACRVSLSARAAAVRRKRHEQRAAELAGSTACDPPVAELGTLIHEEIERLPGQYRAPIVLCFLEGLTREQAAGQLRWPLGTLQSRLARGRERLRQRLIRRGVGPSVILSDASFRAETARAVVPAALAEATTRAVLAAAAGRLMVIGSLTAPAALTEEVLRTMVMQEFRLIAGGMMAGVVLAVMGAVATGAVRAWPELEPRPDPAPPAAAAIASLPAPAPAPTPENPAPPEVVPDAPAEPAEAPSVVEKAAAVLKYGDGQPDGKQSLGGSGEMISFSATKAPARVTGLRIHGSRYGDVQPPDESFLIYFLTEDRKRVLHTEMAPYSLFERGPEQWVEVAFERPVELPKTFWVAVDFRAHGTKGVYVSYDNSTNGRHSLVGLPGTPTARSRRGDWMIEAVLAE